MVNRRPTIQEHLYAYKAKGYQLSHDLNITGWRSKDGLANRFNDYITLLWKDDDNLWHLKTYVATTVPGQASLVKPVNDQGTAILVPGQYLDSWIIGPFKGKTVLRQSRPVKVYRDNNKDAKLESKGKIYSGIFGIHIHGAGAQSVLVDSWSAGCQVIAKAAEFADFMSTVQERATIKNINSFSYTLIEYEQK